MNPAVVRLFTQTSRESHAAESSVAPTSAADDGGQAASTVSETVRSSGRLGRWRLGRKRSEREGVTLYEAWSAPSPGDRAPYIIKLLRRDAPAPALEALRREATAAREVNDSHVVWVAAAQLQEPPHYLVMPRLRGRTGRSLLAEGKPLGVATALWIVRQAVQGLAALHRHGWLHGDVKPANLLVSPRGHVTLLDLGCARKLDVAEVEATPYLAGTIEYMAPEALTSRLRIDVRSDLFSVGVTLHELLTGCSPVPATTTAEMLERRRAESALDPRDHQVDVPLELAELVLSLTAREPLRRPQSADELLARLASLEIAFLERR
jgi:serine/threonine protein kinase